MIKLLAVISLCVGLSAVSSQSCSATSTLRTQYGFANTVTTPTAASGLNYCASIKTGTVCCTAADINSLQTKTNALLTNMTNTVITRDQFFKTANVNPLQQLTAATTTFSATVTSFTSTPATNNANTVASHQDILESLQSIQESVQMLIQGYALAIPATNLKTFQAARTSCVTQMVKLQSAAWCLSCDPNAATKGYNSGSNTLPLSADSCNKLKAACYPFVSTADFQNGPIEIQDLIGTMNKFNQLVAKIQSGQATTTSDLIYTSTAPPTSSLPDSCTSQANCDFICNGLFMNGMINQDDLIAGGDITNNATRLLEQVEPRMLADRGLQSGTYDPADDEAGVTVSFQNDPGNTDKSGILSFGSVLIGAIALLSSYLL